MGLFHFTGLSKDIVAPDFIFHVGTVRQAFVEVVHHIRQNPQTVHTVLHGTTGLYL